MEQPLEHILAAIYSLIAGPLTLFATLIGAMALGSHDALYESFVVAWDGSPGVQLARGLVSGLVYVACGIFLLRGASWARILFLGWSWTMLVINVLTGPHFRGGWSVFGIAQVVLTIVLSYLLLTMKRVPEEGSGDS